MGNPVGVWDCEVTGQGSSDAGSGLRNLAGTGWPCLTLTACNGLPGVRFLRAGVERIGDSRLLVRTNRPNQQKAGNGSAPFQPFLFP